MKSFLFCILPLVIQASAAALSSLKTPPPVIREDEFHKIPFLIKAFKDLSVAYGQLDGPSHGMNGSKVSPFSQLTSQIGAMVKGMMGPTLDPVRLENLAPRFVKTALRKKVRYGPFYVKANSVCL
jgi:hypothetical protein